MVKEVDVVVVGAGPGGSTAARECAERGLSVVLLDKAQFPRDKPCGGGVNVRAARLLPFALDEVIERRVVGMEVSVRRKGAYRKVAESPITYMTRRRRLDALLVQRAIDAGAVLRERAPVREVTAGPDVCHVRAGTEQFVARVVVAADGANGRTAKLAGIAVDLHRGIAMEARAPLSSLLASRYRDTLSVDLGTVPGGFGWMFPKGDHVNIGVGGWMHEAVHLRTRLATLARGYGIDPGDVEDRRAHIVPVRKPRSALVHGRVVLVGDAAGLVDPLSGEGIHAAIQSGRLAAEHIAAHLRGDAPDLDGYRRAIEADLGRELSIGLMLHDLVQLAPGASARGLEHAGFLWDFAFRLLRGDRALRDLGTTFGPAWPAVEMAARVGTIMRVYRHWRADVGERGGSGVARWIEAG